MPDWIIRVGKQHTRDWSVLVIDGGTATTRIGSSGNEKLTEKEEQQEHARLEHPGWRARRKGEEHLSPKKKAEPKDSAP